jgi:hypothetical protein
LAASTAWSKTSILDFAVRRSFLKIQKLVLERSARVPFVVRTPSPTTREIAQEREQIMAATPGSIFSRSNFRGFCRQEAAPKNVLKNISSEAFEGHGIVAP